MKKTHLIFFLLLSFVVVSSVAYGADCKQIAQAIKKERNFIKRKDMVEKGFESCPESPVLNFMYALTKERFNQQDAALKYYMKAAKLAPKMAKAYFGMGDVYTEMGEEDLAILAYSKGLSLEPTNVRAIRSKQALLNNK